ncbi:MAG: hypothetical protein WA996_00230 [Candidatus Promineifilaceae bacterium]
MAEKKPIVRVYFAKLKEAWFQLSEKEQIEFMRKDNEKLEELGCTFTTYDCSWSNDEWQFFAVEEWPTIEAIEKFAKFQEEELEISRYVESKTFLGTRVIEDYGKE